MPAPDLHERYPFRVIVPGFDSRTSQHSCAMHAYDAWLLNGDPARIEEWKSDEYRPLEAAAYNRLRVNRMTYEQCANRFRRLTRLLQHTGVLSRAEAACCLRDYLRGDEYSGEAVNHNGRTTQELLRQALELRNFYVHRASMRSTYRHLVMQYNNPWLGEEAEEYIRALPTPDLQRYARAYAHFTQIHGSFANRPIHPPGVDLGMLRRMERLLEDFHDGYRMAMAPRPQPDCD